MVLGTKRLEYGGEATRVGNRGETTRGKRPGTRGRLWGETSGSVLELYKSQYLFQREKLTERREM